MRYTRSAMIILRRTYRLLGRVLSRTSTSFPLKGAQGLCATLPRAAGQQTRRSPGNQPAPGPSPTGSAVGPPRPACVLTQPPTDASIRFLRGALVIATGRAASSWVREGKPTPGVAERGLHLPSGLCGPTTPEGPAPAACTRCSRQPCSPTRRPRGRSAVHRAPGPHLLTSRPPAVLLQLARPHAHCTHIWECVLQTRSSPDKLGSLGAQATTTQRPGEPRESVHLSFCILGSGVPSARGRDGWPGPRT